MPINRVGAAGISNCTVAAQDIEDATLTNDNFGPGSISNPQLANSSITVNGTSASLGSTLTLKEEINWQAVQVADGSTQVVATAGKGYFLDTNAGVIEVFLPSSPTRGDVVAVVDYAGTFATNQCIVNTGGVNIDSTVGSEFKLTTNETIAYFIYADSNKGWMVYLNQAAGTTPDSILTEYGYDVQNTFITATGGTITTSGDYKIHAFTGDGTFCVSAGAGPLATVDYLVVAGGGSGGTRYGGGGGGGGYRESHCATVSGCYTASPLATPTSLQVSVQAYPITVGGGGSGVSCTTGDEPGNRGSSSVFSTITSTGGGGGQGQAPGTNPNIPGGSGGGGSYEPGIFGAGNTPPVSPPQGNPGGTGNPGGAIAPYSSGGGGGAGAAASAAPGPISGTGGAGVTTSISGSPTAYAGGGGGGASEHGATGAPGGSGGGTAGGTSPGSTTTAGTANTGGGSGGGYGGLGNSGAGGKGIVIIRYKFQ